MSSYRVEAVHSEKWGYEGPEFPTFGLRIVGGEIVLSTIVTWSRARAEKVTDEVVESIIKSTWAVDHIETEQHPDLRRTVYYVAFNKPTEVVVTA